MRTFFVAALLAACSSPATPVKQPAPVAAQPPAAAAPPVEPGLDPAAPTLRLPRNFVPASYAARLAIDPAKSGFDGAIAITGSVSQRSSTIWLHGRKLKIKHAAATGGAGGPIELTATPSGEDLLAFHAATPLAAGTWTLAIDYTGEFDETNTTGAFKQTVANEPYIFTQFEATYAHWAFPCFDEPDNKVPWKLTLDVPAKLTAVSNTPVEHEQPLGPETKRVEFAATKPLPSYLVAFGVGPFDIVDAGRTKSGIPVRVIALKDRAPDAAWAAKTSAPLIDLLEEFFGSPYPYPKMDMLAIPVTVGFGAMENAGLITFTETLILTDPKKSSRRSQYGWISVAAHELAHQWFGDLVTTAWWDDIWLNEGFANWVERKITVRFDPTWRDEQAEVSQRNSALGSDSLVSARQIRQPISSVGDIANAFDGITYNKGASVLNMFEGYLGHDAFITGVRAYIKQHAFGNATSTEFAQAISKAAGKDVGPAFATFLEQPGAPEITATLACDAGQPPRVTVSQQRYVPPGAEAPTAGKPWIVPVCVAYDRGGKRAEACGLIDGPTGSIALEAQSCPRWMMPNVDGRGYYRNLYTAAQVASLRDDAWPQLKPTERRVVVFDATEAATLRKLPLAVALSFVPKLVAASDRFSVGDALSLPGEMRQVMPEDLLPAYEAWLRRTFGAPARKAGLVPRDGDSLDVESVRGNLVQVVAFAGKDPVLTAEAVKLSDKWRDLPQSVRATVVALAVRSNPAVFDRLLKEAHTEPDRARRDELLNGLAGTPDPKRQVQALSLILDPTMDIRDTQFMLFGRSNEANALTARKFFMEHQDEILKRIPTDGATGGNTWLTFVFTSNCSPEHRDEYADYVTKTFGTLPGGDRPVRQGIENMDQCIARKKLIEPELRSWLRGGTSPARASK
jgi:alanyl aminopeptidase